MKLYEKKISPNGKVSYVEHAVSIRADIEIDDRQINTLVSTIVICWLHAMHKQLSDIKKGSALSTKVKAVEEAISGMATLSSGKLDERMVQAGTAAWGAAIRTVANELMKAES